MSYDLRQEPRPKPEVLISSEPEETTPRSHAAEVRVIRQISTFHSSVLPDAETLHAYSKLIPNGPERIMGLIEREAAHRHRRITRDHWMAYTLTLSLTIGGIYMGVTGHDWLAAALFTTTIGAVATAFIVGKRERTRADGK
jgi:uncharacterized membrane protein